MLRRIPLRAKRKPALTAEIKRHHTRVRALPCAVPGCWNPSTLHHVSSDGFKRITRSEMLVVPLCAPHHQKVWDPIASDPISVEGLGHAGFTAKYGVDLYALAQQIWQESKNQ